MFSHFRHNLSPTNWQFIIAAVFFLFFAINMSVKAAEPLIVKHYDQGYTPSIRAYQRDLLHLMLARTEPTFGPYKLEFFSMPLSTNRAKIVLQQGNDVNVLFASEWQGWGVDPSQVIVMELPIYKGLHGLRNIIVRAEDARLFEQLDSLSGFLKLSAGQGANWLDLDILRANQVSVVEAQSFNNLMPMLEKKRFDYLPLSVLEADAVLHAQSPVMRDLAICSDLVVFYPLPSFLYIPKEQPEIARRLLAGFSLIEKSGELDELFNRHFYGVDRVINGERKRVIVFNNPDLSPEKNQQMIDNLMTTYGKAFVLLK